MGAENVVKGFLKYPSGKDNMSQKVRGESKMYTLGERQCLKPGHRRAYLDRY